MIEFKTPMSFIQSIRTCIEEFAPLSLAQGWDNTGVLIDCDNNKKGNILLTIDLTEDVLEECISKGISYIVAYHPIIFGNVKKLDGSTTTNKVVVRCIQNNISVYSPHSQLDPVMNGYIHESICSLVSDLKFDNIIDFLRVKSGIAKFRIVKSKKYNKDKAYLPENIHIGVGATFRDVSMTDCLLITGEMSHHVLLKCKYSGVEVIMMEHSNSERIFLEELKRLILLNNDMSDLDVLISQTDIDPITII